MHSDPETQGLGTPLSKVGFPIRTSTDQSFFAAPRGFSQRSTSFIASQRQGIHRTPLRHLIALIINAHPLGSGPSDRSIEPAFWRTQVVANSSSGWTLIRKTSLSSDRSDSTAVKQCRQKRKYDRGAAQLSLRASRSDLSAQNSASFVTFVTAMLGAILPLHDVRYHACCGLTDEATRNCFLNGRA